jgi:hypothetical protein
VVSWVPQKSFVGRNHLIVPAACLNVTVNGQLGGNSEMLSQLRAGGIELRTVEPLLARLLDRRQPPRWPVCRPICSVHLQRIGAFPNGRGIELTADDSRADLLARGAGYRSRTST